MPPILSALLLAATVTGTVTYTGDGFLFLQERDRAMKVRFQYVRSPLPAIGDVVSADGERREEGGRTIFSATGWNRTASAAALPEPKVPEDAELVRYSADPAADVNWRRVRIEGRAMGLTERGFAMKVGDFPVNVIAEDLPDFMNDAGETRPKVVVTGVVELILDPTALADGDSRYVMGVKLFAESKESIVLDPDLSYLMNRRDRRVRIAYFALLGLAVALVILLIAFLLAASRRQLRTKTIMAERKRMADDLHDTIEQHLVGAGMLLQLGKVKESREILVRAKKEMRDIVWGLKNDDMMRLSPADMIREVAKEENRKGVCRVDAMLKGLPEHLDAAAMRDLSLIVREAIGNAVKHGGAKKVAIASDPQGKGWVIRLANDGRPFDAATAPGPKEGHFGLDGMRQRARRLGAELSIAVESGRTVVTLRSMP